MNKPIFLQRFREFPASINIEPTNRCNFKCKICPRRESSKPVGTMSMNLYTKLIDEIAEHKNTTIVLHKDGEPLLHPDIVKMVKYATDRNITTVFNTNGYYLNRVMSGRLIDARLDRITVSLYSTSEKTYTRLTGMNCLKRVDNNTTNLIRLRDERGMNNPMVRAFTVECELTVHETHAFYIKWKDIADEVRIDKFTSWGGQKLDKYAQSSPSRFPCPLLWNSLAINWNGVVNPCCQDWNSSIILGDAEKETISEIWNGSRMKLMRDMHKSNPHNTLFQCNNCNFWFHKHKNIFFKVHGKWR